MFRKIFAMFVAAAALVFAFSLVGCGGQDATGYQGNLEDGSSFVYIQMGDEVIASIVDDEHMGDDADAYQGKATTGASGKITITDEETGKTLSFTMTENADGTCDVDVDGHGKGTLKLYEGNILELVTAMAEDDEGSES